MQARLAHLCDIELAHPDTGIRGEVYEVGYLSDWLEPCFEHKLHCRMIPMIVVEKSCTLIHVIPDFHALL
jgi:hypothetical protein